MTVQPDVPHEWVAEKLLDDATAAGDRAGFLHDVQVALSVLRNAGDRQENLSSASGRHACPGCFRPLHVTAGPAACASCQAITTWIAGGCAECGHDGRDDAVPLPAPWPVDPACTPLPGDCGCGDPRPHSFVRMSIESATPTTAADSDDEGGVSLDDGWWPLGSDDEADDPQGPDAWPPALAPLVPQPMWSLFPKVSAAAKPIAYSTPASPAVIESADADTSEAVAPAPRHRDLATYYHDTLRDCIESLAGFHSPDPTTARWFQRWQAEFYDRLNYPSKWVESPDGDNSQAATRPRATADPINLTPPHTDQAGPRPSATPTTCTVTVPVYAGGVSDQPIGRLTLTDVAASVITHPNIGIELSTECIRELDGTRTLLSISLVSSLVYVPRESSESPTATLTEATDG